MESDWWGSACCSSNQNIVEVSFSFSAHVICGSDPGKLYFIFAPT